MKKTHDNLHGTDLYHQFTDRGDGTQRLSFHVQDGDRWKDVTKQVWKPGFAKEWCELHDQERIHGFWGRYRWASNFFLKPITVSGDFWGGSRDFPSSEHAYQFAKLPADEQDKWYTIICQYTCFQVKQWGQEIQIRSGWDNLREPVMDEVVLAKFTQNQEPRDLLLATGTATMVESNWWGDVFFGVDPTAPVNGLNVLGRVLMKTRERLA